MRTKLFALSILCSLSFIALAEHFEVPTGRYQFKSISLFNLKHVLLLDSRSSKDREKVEDLRRKDYLCRRVLSHKVQCHRYIKDFDGDLEIPSSELKSFETDFDENSIVSLITEADLVSIFEVKQNVSSSLGSTNTYKLYVKEDGKKHLDVQFEKKLHRYSYQTPQTLTKFIKKREKISKKEHREYSYFLEFEKED